MDEKMRAEFEAWIASPPYEKPVTVCPDGSAWTGQYRAYEVQLAWEAWQASRAAPVVELPKASRQVTWDDESVDVMWPCEVVEAIEAAGVRVK